jgi:hypothetical protein
MPLIRMGWYYAIPVIRKRLSGLKQKALLPTIGRL